MDKLIDVLVVDDEPDVLDVVEAMLRDAGYSLMRCPCADVGAFVIDQGVRFRLLLTDVVLPGTLDGFGLARKAKEAMPSVSVIYATGFGGLARVRAQGAPYGMILAKPFRRAALIEAVDKALRQVAA